ncbi:MAG TPA: DinB family protein [Gemmatimonadaceae bacterium]|nr:DinB family protein [Gemmatimonadaceae bacterium]
MADAFDLAEAREVIAQTPAVVRALLGELSEPWLNATEGGDTWSPRDVVAHLVDLEDTDWLVRANQIMTEGAAGVFAPIDRVRFREVLADKSVDELLALFDARRKRNLDEIDAMRLTRADFSRSGTHPALGAVTLEHLLASWVVHDMTHLAQIVRVIAKRYDSAVGPWKEYLSILAVKR